MSRTFWIYLVTVTIKIDILLWWLAFGNFCYILDSSHLLVVFSFSSFHESLVRLKGNIHIK